MTNKRSRIVTVRDYYREEDTAQKYDDIRFGNAGGRIVDTVEKKIVFDLLRHHPKDKAILDVAAGTGRFSLALARQGYKIVAVDGSSAMLKLIEAAARRENLDITCIQVDAFNLPFDDNTFESVFSIRFVWHFRNYSELVAELTRVTKRRLVFDMINSASLAAITAPVANHLLYRSLHTETASRSAMSDLLGKFGLDIKDERTALAFPYIFYRRLPFLSGILSAIDNLALAAAPVGSVLYYGLEKR